MLYVAYGSNMSKSQMAYRCPNSKVICNGKLYGYKLVFNYHADVIKTENKNDFVPVVVWNIADSDWNRLDMYEGYPSYYVKEIVDVVLENDNIETAIVYVMTDNRKGIYPPDKTYFECIEEGYVDNGISVNGLYDALMFSIYNTTEYNKYNTKEMM